jgi:two-component system nitrogen regulation sensor histidine kinase NtrY
MNLSHLNQPPQTGFSFWQFISRMSLLRFVAALLLIAIVYTMSSLYQMIAASAGEEVVDTKILMTLVLICLILLLCLVALVSSRIIRLWANLRKGSLGSRLQTRIVTMFCIVTIVPTVVVSVFSAVFFNLGVQTWFNDRVSKALTESVAVAEAYLNEHKEIIRADAIAMANDLNRDSHYIITNPQAFNSAVSTQVALRSLTEAIVIQHNRIIAQTQFSFAITFERLPIDAMERAANGEIVVMLEDGDKVRALVRLNQPDTLLLIGRLVDSKVVAHMESATGGVKEYRRLKSNISKLQIQFSLVFLFLAVLLLMLAIWYGLHFASRLFVPLSQLVNAADRVRAGDYDVRIKEGPKDDELGTLSRAFNRMTNDLQQQRQDLIEANRQIDTRRRFSEAVLFGVSAGVVALDSTKRISLANRAAEQLLNLTAQDKSRSITDLFPQLQEFLIEAEKPASKLVQGNISVSIDGKPRTFNIRINAETIGDEIEGFIVTFDDVTELLIAQRNTAWADVARRVAHEIKNPLTPIQLAAERLKKKYLPMITFEPENFQKYTDTIAKHAGDIGQMVEEFVSFARMPAPEFKQEDVLSILRRIVFSEQIAHNDITYDNQLPEEKVFIKCDERQLSQVFINLLKNAAEAMEPKMLENKDYQPRITIKCETFKSNCRIVLSDNGPGFPADKIQKLMEPYFTTRARGTGLGLAIVKKIMDDHKATLTLENHPEGGAQAILNFSIDSGKNVT